MLVDSDAVSLDTFPTNVVVHDEPLPHEESGGCAVTEVLVISHGEHSGGGGQDPLRAVMQDLTAPILEDTDAETLEACHVQLVESANRLASMRRLSEAYQREMDRAVGGTPAPGGPSRIVLIRQRGATIASHLSRLRHARREHTSRPGGSRRARQAGGRRASSHDGARPAGP